MTCPFCGWGGRDDGGRWGWRCDIADGYDPLTLTSVAVTTVLAVAASGGLFAMLRRRTRSTQTVFAYS